MKKVAAVLLIASALVPFANAQAASVRDNVAGKILLQVEQNGEAWYVNPETKERHFLYRADSAYQIMRGQGVGITNANLERIPIGYYKLSNWDADNDGLTDAMEQAIGTNPNDSDSDNDGYNDGVEVQNDYNPLVQAQRSKFDHSFARQQSGKIFLQVESRGEAWWVNPEDNRRYYLGRAQDAYELMRAKGLGITNTNLGSIPVSETLMNCEQDTECFYSAVEVDQMISGKIDNSVTSGYQQVIDISTEKDGDAYLLHYFVNDRSYEKDEGTCRFENKDKVQTTIEELRAGNIYQLLFMGDRISESEWHIKQYPSAELLGTCIDK